MKRKRDTQTSLSAKRQKLGDSNSQKTRPCRVLTSCYPAVLSLREYLTARLPLKSQRRKRFNASFRDGIDVILDNWKVGVLSEPTAEVKRARSQEFVAFTQTQPQLHSTPYTARTQTCSFNEVLEFVIWHLFNASSSGPGRPKHVLCTGLQRGIDPERSSVAPGIIQCHPSENLRQLKSEAWNRIFAALGAAGESIAASLFLDCGLFSSLDDGKDNYYQVSGQPINELARQARGNDSKEDLSLHPRAPGIINIVRNRMLYAKPSLNASGKIRFGLKHIHVLQRCSDLQDKTQTIHILKHVFPRQFGLHNVFTSTIDKKQTSQPFLDYIYREDEIAAAKKRAAFWIPHRLRGAPLTMVDKIRKRHARLSYSQLLRHYCSITSSRPLSTTTRLPGSSCGTVSTALNTQFSRSSAETPPQPSSRAPKNPDRSFVAHATATTDVSAFCQAVLKGIIPTDAFGVGEQGRSNWRKVLCNVGRFIDLRRFETTNLHQLCQDLNLNCIHWLAPASVPGDQKTSLSDRKKRLELLREFVYYLFDSLLIPLIQSNFYVTESGPQRNRLYYFRHDVWRKMAEPNFAIIRSGIYQQLKPSEIRQMLSRSSLGYSHVRLLPKDEGTRTITNLRRRMVTNVKGQRLLGPSINTQLSPVFGALTHERLQDPARLGTGILSVNGLHERLKQFKSILALPAKLYFVKVDIQSCFDSIPQNRLLNMIESLIGRTSYRTSRYAESKPSADRKARQRYLQVAKSATDEPVLSHDTLTEVAAGKAGRIYNEVGFQKVWSAHQLLALLQQHIRSNVVKIGKKHFRQDQGIPQGSVLSSLLCTFFYTAFERDHLHFVNASEGILIRLIDDFLLITTDLSTARNFLKTMTQPHEDYGITVNPQKTLANFEATVNGHKIPRQHGSSDFPYCGMTIDMTSLQLGKDRLRKDAIVRNGLTVDMSSKARSTFERKAVTSFVQQMHKMLLDGAMNSPEQQLSTMLEAFTETAMKLHSYVRAMPPQQRPSERKIMNVVRQLLRLGIKYGRQRLTEDGVTESDEQFLTKTQAVWAGCSAFVHVLSTKQTRYRGLLRVLEQMRQRSEAGLGTCHRTRRRLLAHRDRVFRDYVY